METNVVRLKVKRIRSGNMRIIYKLFRDNGEFATNFAKSITIKVGINLYIAIKVLASGKISLGNLEFNSKDDAFVIDLTPSVRELLTK